MALLNYTTSIAANRTAAEVQAALAKHGAGSVSILYTAGEPAGLAFTIGTEFGDRRFQLPANAAGVEATIRRQQKAGEIRREARYLKPGHANKVAWRILKDWVEAQLAIIEAGMTTLDEVMLPYMLTASGRTLTQSYRESDGMRAALESGGNQ